MKKPGKEPHVSFISHPTARLMCVAQLQEVFECYCRDESFNVALMRIRLPGYEDRDLNDVSRQIWNRLVAELITPQQRQTILNEGRVVAGDLEPLSEDERAMVADVWKAKTSRHSVNILNADLRAVNFDEPVCFDGYLFDTLVLDGCIFEDLASFNDIYCFSSLEANDVVFLGEAEFCNAIIGGKLSLGGTTYIERTSFKYTAAFVETKFRGFVSFRDTSFGIETTFERARFANESLFVNSTFGGSTNFKSVQFRLEAPKMFGATLHEDTDFSSIEWPKLGSKLDWAQNVRNYERLKLIMGQQGKFRQEHQFLRLEMRSQEQIDGFWSSLPSRFFRITSDYGWSYSRPLSFLGMGLLVGWGILSAIVCGADSSTSEPFGKCSRSMLFVSFSNLVSFLGLQRNVLKEEFARLSAHPFAEGVSVVQMIYGPIIIFFLLLALRNRFRMK